ncbi:MAG: sulfur carrier protein ThiS [Desulfuromonadaceae bacterium]|nr:sulfur carrier protein ThiS [Desulfuromonadaceae bacterium]
MEIILNGKARACDGLSTLQDLVEQLKLDPQRIAVEHNRCVVARDQLAHTPLNAGDEVEIVNFVGGG